MATNQPVVQVDQLSKQYRNTKAVDQVSFTIQPGEIFGIIGPNGAGKTTLVEMLAGLRKPDSGSIRVLGLNPQRQADELHQRIGVQLQQAALPDYLRVWEALDLFASFYQHSRDWRPLIQTWGLSEKRNSAFSALSGGQKQRLFIALALVNDPELVFLDELTTGLDPQARHTTWDLVREIRAQGKTVVLVTHFMDEAEKLCDRVAIMEQGHLVALNTPKQLIAGLQAETRVKFTTSNGFNPAELRNIPGVTRTEREGDQATIFGKNVPGCPSLLLQVATVLGERGLSPTDLRTEQASLEDVFIALTGKQIRE